MRRVLSLSVLLAFGLAAFAACDKPTPTDPTLEPAELSASSHAPGAPVAIPFSNTFPDDDPCTPTFDPNEHLVTIAGTAQVHSLPNGNIVVRSVERTITTDSGYEGRGEETFVRNGQILMNQWNDLLTHPDGRKIRIHVTAVLDLTTDPPTLQALSADFVCIKS